MGVKQITEVAELEAEQAQAGDKLVVLDFYATWCGPCKEIAPFLEELSQEHTNVVFLKADVEVAADLTDQEGVSAMPTFVFYKNKNKLEALRGADKNRLQQLVQKFK